MLTEPKVMTDEERELHIKDCGRLMQEAYDAGRREEAEGWLQAMNQAIAARSQAQVTAMEKALMQRIYEPCYFFTRGEEDSSMFHRTQAA